MAFNLADVLKNVSDPGTEREQIVYIPLTALVEDPNNFYELSEIPALADNIALCGLQQPIRVRPFEDGHYRIVSGHRRRAALEMLVADGYEQWKEAPCIIEQDAVSPTLQQLRLIYANANTRKMSAAEISEQAEQVEKLLYQLKEEGYDFPGRMRDHVAEAVGQSKSKLARLKVIRENLAACWADDWKNGNLNESQAYALSQMPKSWQGVIKENYGYAVSSLHADAISRFKEKFQNIVKIECQYGLQMCEHTVTMMGKVAKETWCVSCTGCCFNCDYLQTCKDCCPEAKGKQKEMKAIAKKASFDAKREQEERDRPGAEFAKLIWQRVGMARKRSGAAIKDIVLARGESFYNAICDDPKQERMENGEGDYSPNSTVSFGYDVRACDMMHVRDVADTLGCSVDFLLGRTEIPEVNTGKAPAEPVSNSGTSWQTGSPPKIGKYLVRLSFGKYFDDRYEMLMWNGSEWHDGSTVHEEEYDGEILGWIPLPKESAEDPDPVSNESCITGMSPNGHCGAAACCDREYACCLQCDDPSCNCRCGWAEDK